MEQSKPKRIDRRKNRFCVRLNEKESIKVKKMMDKTGKSGPQLMRNALLSLPPDIFEPIHSSEQAAIFFLELKKVGEEINEVAKKLNSGEITSRQDARLNHFAAAFVRLRMMLEGRIPIGPEAPVPAAPATT